MPHFTDLCDNLPVIEICAHRGKNTAQRRKFRGREGRGAKEAVRRGVRCDRLIGREFVEGARRCEEAESLKREIAVTYKGADSSEREIVVTCE